MKKDLNKNLNELHTLLRKSVGKRWEGVYSDICQKFDKRKVINQHTLIHLFQTVEINTFVHKGVVCYAETNTQWKGTQGVQPITQSSADYFVHPTTKVLTVNKGSVKRKQQEEKAQEEHIEKAGNNLRLISRFGNKNGGGARYAMRIKGVWYEVSVVAKPKPVKRRRLNGHGKTEYYYHHPEIQEVSIYGAKFLPQELNNDNFYVCRKEQLSNERLRKLGLR